MCVFMSLAVYDVDVGGATSVKQQQYRVAQPNLQIFKTLPYVLSTGAIEHGQCELNPPMVFFILMVENVTTLFYEYFLISMDG